MVSICYRFKTSLRRGVKSRLYRFWMNKSKCARFGKFITALVLFLIVKNLYEFLAHAIRTVPNGFRRMDGGWYDHALKSQLAVKSRRSIQRAPDDYDLPPGGKGRQNGVLGRMHNMVDDLQNADKSPQRVQMNLRQMMETLNKLNASLGRGDALPLRGGTDGAVYPAFNNSKQIRLDGGSRNRFGNAHANRMDRGQGKKVHGWQARKSALFSGKDPNKIDFKVDPNRLVYLPNEMAAAQPYFGKYNTNIRKSNGIPLNRPVADIRERECLAAHYGDKLPDVTFVIPFYNEASSLILRTVHSILERTPDELLNEIILIDDLSTYADLGDMFENYIIKLKKVRLLRNRERQGLVRTRQIGFDEAKGEVVFFLDCHTEMFPGFLEPILNEIALDPSAVVQPLLIGINPDTMDFPPFGHALKIRSTFSWQMGLAYLQPAAADLENDMTVPFNVPALVGCAFAVQRRYFESIGGYDRDMDLWGGENIEVPFRVWMCGGRVITAPCSRVGHVFRKLPYMDENNKGDPIGRNAARVVEVWFDKYKRLFYSLRPPTALSQTDLANVEKRKAEKEKMQCKNFDWFLSNVIPDLKIPPPNVVGYGNLMWGLETRMCMGVRPSDGEFLVGPGPCDMRTMYTDQFFYMDKHGVFVYMPTDECVGIDFETGKLQLFECEGMTEDFWKFKPSGQGYIVGYVQEMVQPYCIVTENVAPTSDNFKPVKAIPCGDMSNYETPWVWTYLIMHDQNDVDYPTWDDLAE